MKHHYVPEFYLKRWATNGLVPGYYWAKDAGRIASKKKGAKAFCNEVDLYALEAVSAEIEQAMETRFFGQIDNQAGKLINRVASDDFRNFSQVECCDWARFLNSLELRRPSIITNLRNRVANEFLESLDEDEEILEAMKKEGVEDSPSQFLKNINPSYVQNRMLLTIQTVIDSQKIGQSYLDMAWMRKNLSEGGIDLITNDQPFVRIGGLGDSNCICYLPLDPQNIFFCSNDMQQLNRIRAEGAREFTKIMNRDIAFRAEKYIFDRSSQNLPLIEKFLSP